MGASHRLGACACCARTRVIIARDLCEGCYRRADRQGILRRFPRRGVTRADVLHFLGLFEEPFGVREIGAVLEIGHPAAQEWVRRLVREGELVEVGRLDSPGGGRKVYALAVAADRRGVA